MVVYSLSIRGLGFDPQHSITREGGLAYDHSIGEVKAGGLEVMFDHIARSRPA